MKLAVSIPLAVVCVAVGVYAASVFSGSTWQSRTAADKFSTLWRKITENTNSGGWPSALSLPQIFIESLDTTFDNIGDDMPTQGPFGWFTRQKLIHSVGAIAQVKWVSVGNHPYTGAFTGASSVFLRPSYAKAPDQTGTVPGMAFKFLRTGRKSANFVAMYDLQGQKSYNFFEHDFSNHVPWLTADAPLAAKALAAKFEGASEWAVMVGLSDLASYTEDGTPVVTPNFPYRLQFHPPTNIRSVMSSQDTGTTLAQRLNDPVFSSGTVVYEVYAQAEPNADVVKIANVVLQSTFTPSLFADQTLFFQHQRMDDDLAIHPEWVAPAYAIKEEQQTNKFNWPDLPDN